MCDFSCLSSVKVNVQRLTLTTRLIFPSPEDEQGCWEMLKAAQLVWNECSKVHFNSGGPNDLKSLHNLFYRPFRDAHPEIPSQIITSNIRSCLGAYRAIKKNGVTLEEPAVKKRFSQTLDQRTSRYTKDGFNFTTLGKRCNASPYLYPRLQEFLDLYPRTSPKLFTRDGEIWAAYTFEVPTRFGARTTETVDEKFKPEDKVLGLDMGVRNFVTTADGIIIRDNTYNTRKRSVRYLKRKLKSKGTRSARKHLKKLRRRERNLSRDFNIRVARCIVSHPATIFGVEDLRGLKKGKCGKKQTQQTPIGEFLEILKYKAHLAGKRVETVDPYLTSQLDHRNDRLGHRHKRRFIGADGVILDAEVNAANNVGQRVNHPNSCSCTALDGQVVVSRPIVPIIPVMGTSSGALARSI